ncbi:hypothetical protein AOQ73_39100 [Bradyrhizobium pachyrhizi]|uniref:hypothetical protein n=1 Tax=Bradyrhizobium pachyrhizi TaxID=280333 RepID=UPI0007055BA1|nr:hypothetical protein [Bradyrhizobium pachyrhizi]KRP85217.1 hypothetical protein AOQ73_39100 [Bradyrhizobium pachyrhizi]
MKDGSNFQAWTLDEALERVPNSKIHLRSGELLAWGRLSDPGAELSYVPPSLWRDSVFSGRSKASKREAICGGMPVFDLRIFPVMEAPNAVEHLGHIPLKDLFNRFVVGDPEVQHLAQFAIVRSPDLRRVYRPSERSDFCFWPLDPDGLIDIGEFTDPIQDCLPGYVHTPETAEVGKVLRRRYRAMVRALHSGLFVAVGDPVWERDSREILPTIWGAPGYYLDRRTGDLLQDRDWGDEETEVTPMLDNSEWYELRWRAVLLRPANPVSSVDKSNETKAGNHKNKFQERFDRCLDYLCKLMKDSPHHRPKTKRMIFRDAKIVCGGNLGWGIFCLAWDAAKEAVPDAVEAWSRAGAPKKSYRK